MATPKTDAEWDSFYSTELAENKEEDPILARLDRIIALLEAQQGGATTINVSVPENINKSHLEEQIRALLRSVSPNSVLRS